MPISLVHRSSVLQRPDKSLLQRWTKRDPAPSDRRFAAPRWRPFMSPVRAALRFAREQGRLDTLLAERGAFPSRSAAAAAVRAGEVRIGSDGPFAMKPGELVDAEADLIVDEGRRFVSRGGIKLDNALAAARRRRRRARLPRRRRLDRRLHRLPAAARRGPRRRGRRRPRAARLAACATTRGCAVIERLNARALGPGDLPFVASTWRRSTSPSSRCARCCPRSPRASPPAGEILALVKPQFELGRERVGKGGVVRVRGGPPRGVLAGRRGRCGDARARRARLRLLGPARARRATGRPSSGAAREGESVADLEAAIAEVEP